MNRQTSGSNPIYHSRYKIVGIGQKSACCAGFLGMCLKFGNYGFRSHLSLAIYSSQLHQKGGCGAPAEQPLVRELSPTPSPPSLRVSKVASLNSTRNYHPKNSYPALPSATKNELIPSSTSQASQAFRAIKLCPHTHLNLPFSSRNGSSSFNHISHVSLTRRKLKRKKKIFGQDLVNKPKLTLT